MSLALSSSWTLDKLSPSNLGHPAIFPQKRFEKLESALGHRYIRTLIPSHPFPSEPQRCALACWNPVPASRSNSQETEVLPF